jgi:hypothetical protein
MRRGTRKHAGKLYSVIYGRLKGKSGMTEQAYRYKKDAWAAGDARAHCSAHGGRFEAAGPSEDSTFARFVARFGLAVARALFRR